MSELPHWLEGVKRTLPFWIDRLAHPDGPGRYRYAVDAYEPYDMDSSHLMHNIIYTTGGGAGGLPDDRGKQRWIDYLCDLQRPDDGLMIDPGMERHLRCAGNAPTPDELHTLRRWTTRNGLMSVMELGGVPRHRLRHSEAFANADELIARIEKMDWSLPWSAGSHTGALILFQHFNQLCGDEQANSLIDAAVAWLTVHQNPADGAWSRGGDVPPHQRINGVMKIWIQVLPITDMPVQYPEAVIDLCIHGLREDPVIAQKVDACSLFDVALVLDIALRFTDHRREEVADLARSFLPRFEPMLRPDGAFSYGPGHSFDNHSGLALAPVKNQSDVVGTAMHTHAIALLCSLAGLRDDLGWTPLTDWRMKMRERACV